MISSTTKWHSAQLNISSSSLKRQLTPLQGTHCWLSGRTSRSTAEQQAESLSVPLLILDEVVVPLIRQIYTVENATRFLPCALPRGNIISLIQGPKWWPSRARKCRRYLSRQVNGLPRTAWGQSNCVDRSWHSEISATGFSVAAFLAIGCITETTVNQMLSRSKLVQLSKVLLFWIW